MISLAPCGLSALALASGALSPLPPSLKVCWGPSRERQRAWGYGRVLKAFSVLSTSFCIGFGPSLSGSHKSLSLCNTLNHHKIKHLQTPQALKPRSGELVIAADEMPQAATCPHSRSFVRRHRWVADIGDHWHCAA
jgi:hypothetical protein